MPALAPALEILDLGLKDYREVWELQRRLAEERLQDRRPDTLILVEHPPVYTRGTSARRKALPELPFPIYDVERGGDITYHGPGQLVGYPIVHLGERKLTVGAYLRLLESILIAALRDFRVPGERIAGLTGVWSGGKKLASIGVAVKGWVSFHGFALNVDCDLGPFRAIRPCGLEPERVSTLKAALGRPVDMREIRLATQGALARALA